MYYLFHQILPKKALSALMYKLSRVENKTFKNLAIRIYMAVTGANLQGATRQSIDDYKSLLDFFTRELADGARTIDFDANVLVSPVDGAIADVGAIKFGRINQIKGHDYSLETLLGKETAERYMNGDAATIYLAPYDYHRIHMPVQAKLIGCHYIPGELNSVSIKLLDKIAGLFARNERVVCEFEADFSGRTRRFVMVLVGAVNVGSIETIIHGEITPCKTQQTKILGANGELFAKGAEFARFNLGSTVILVTEAGQFNWADFTQGQMVQLGQPLATVNTVSEQPHEVQGSND